jgi:hypothetical protein
MDAVGTFGHDVAGIEKRQAVREKAPGELRAVFDKQTLIDFRIPHKLFRANAVEREATLQTDASHGCGIAGKRTAVTAHYSLSRFPLQVEASPVFDIRLVKRISNSREDSQILNFVKHWIENPGHRVL